jgi:hypothetical protein
MCRVMPARPLFLGDIVELKFRQVFTRAEVIEYGFMDNNSVRVRDENGREIDYVAEWCKVITKVEDRK